MRLDVKIFGTKKARKLLADIEKRAKSLRPFLQGPMTNRIHEMFEKIFDTEGAYIGHTWPQLKASTLRQKRLEERGDMGILRRHNTLWSSLTKRGGGGLGTRVVTDHSLEIGTTVPWALSHQEGTDTMEPRVIVPDDNEIPNEEKLIWEGLMVRYLEGRQ